jgi:trehalose/maltose hydrolase-like predicted phosphorylase
LIQRCYTGITISKDTLWINPQLTENLREIKLKIRYRGNWLNIILNHEELEIYIKTGLDKEINLGYKGNRFQMKTGDYKKIKLN